MGTASTILSSANCECASCLCHGVMLAANPTSSRPDNTAST